MIKIDLTELVQSPKTNSISGRSFGEDHATKTKLVAHMKNGEKIIIIIDDTKVKAINDSFIKGFFSKAFEYFKTADKIRELVELQCSVYYKNLFSKNWTILEAINKG